MKIFTAYPENKKQIAAFIALSKALNIDFNVEESPYDPEFVAMVQQADEDFKAGRKKNIVTADLWK